MVVVVWHGVFLHRGGVFRPPKVKLPRTVWFVIIALNNGISDMPCSAASLTTCDGLDPECSQSLTSTLKYAFGESLVECQV